MTARPASTAPPGNSREPDLAQKAGGYLLVGGLAAVVDIGLFHLLAPNFQDALLPAILSFIVAAVVNYSLSSLWVYRREWRSLRRAMLFALFACVGLCINAGVTWWLASAFPIPPTLAKVAGVGVAFGANFLMNTFLVFARRDHRSAGAPADLPPRPARGTTRSFLQFGALSGGGWLLDCALLLLLASAAGLPLPIANFISSSVAALTVFTLSRFLVFTPASGRTALRTFLYFLYTCAVIVAASLVIGPIAGLTKSVADSLAIGLGATQVAFLAKVIVTPPQLLANFFMSRYLAEYARREQRLA